MGRPDRETYVPHKGYPLELIERIEKEDRARVFPNVNPRRLVESISALAEFRALIGSREVFFGHLSSATILTRGLGLVLWEIHRIIRQNRRHKVENPFDFFFGSRYADMLSSNPKKFKVPTTISCLVKHGILKMVGEPIVDVIPTEYRLDDDWIGICPSELSLWQKGRRKITKKWARKKQIARRPWILHMDAALSKTYISETPELEAALEKENTRHAALKAIAALERCQNIPDYQGCMAKYGGTIYTPINSMPRMLVATLKIANERVVQLDISSAHPCTLVRLLLDLAPMVGIEQAHKEADRLRAEMESGTLYERLAKECGLDKETAKRRFIAALNGKNGHTYNEVVFQAFARSYPVTKRVIAIVRKKNRKILHRKMTYILSCAMDQSLKFCMDQNLPVFSRADEIVCRDRDADVIRKVLGQAFHNFTTVKPKVGGEILSWDDIYSWDESKPANEIIGNDNEGSSARQGGLGETDRQSDG